MTTTPQLSDKHRDPNANDRALALAQAHTVAGSPTDYRFTSEQESKGDAKPAPGIPGKFGATVSGNHETSKTTHTDYPSALIALADYIHTGRRHEDDDPETTDEPTQADDRGEESENETDEAGGDEYPSAVHLADQYEASTAAARASTSVSDDGTDDAEQDGDQP